MNGAYTGEELVGRSRPGGAQHVVVQAALVFLLVLVVYLNSFPGAFFLDDKAIVQHNPLVKNPKPNRIFTTDYWGEKVNSGLYRPLTILGYGVNRRLLGSRPVSFHAVNVLLHGLVSVLFLLVLRAVPFAPLLALAAASLFAVHPVHTGVLNMVVGRAELQAAFFVMSGLLLSLSSFRGRSIAVGLSFVAALLSKESAFTFPLLLYAVAVFRGGGWRLPLRKDRLLYGLLAVLALSWLALRAWVGSLSAVPPDPLYASNNPLVELALLERVLSVMKIQILTLAKLAAPVSLSAVQNGRDFAVIEKILTPWGAAAILVPLSLAALAIAGWRRQRGYGLGLFMYALSFAVTSNLFFLIAIHTAERMVYLPSAGFCLAAASLFVQWPGISRPVLGRRVSAAAVAFYLLFLSSLTIGRNADYESPLRLFRVETERNPLNGRAWYLLAGEYRSLGRLKEAKRAYVSSITADPLFPDVYASYSGLLLDLGQPEEALRFALIGIHRFPGVVGRAYLNAARASLELGRPEEAVEWLGKMGENYGWLAQYWTTGGRALDALGDVDGAIESYYRAELWDGDPPVGRRLVSLLLSRWRHEEAEGVARRYLEGREDAEMRNLLGVSLALQRRHSEAAEAFRAALAIDPGSSMYRENLEKALVDAGEARGDLP